MRMAGCKMGSVGMARVDGGSGHWPSTSAVFSVTVESANRWVPVESRHLTPLGWRDEHLKKITLTSGQPFNAIFNGKANTS